MMGDIIQNLWRGKKRKNTMEEYLCVWKCASACSNNEGKAAALITQQKSIVRLQSLCRFFHLHSLVFCSLLLPLIRSASDAIRCRARLWTLWTKNNGTKRGKISRNAQAIKQLHRKKQAHKSNFNPSQSAAEINDPQKSNGTSKHQQRRLFVAEETKRAFTIKNFS